MRGKILIVDDEQTMCEMLEDDLKRHGFHPTWYISAEKALDALKTDSSFANESLPTGPICR
jgi:DNA-binding response OmpR family regulator